MRTRDSIPDPLHLRLSGSTAAHDAVAAARSFSQSAKLDEASASRLAIIVEELVLNLYDHGGLETGDPFEMELAATRVEVRLALTSPGPEFDPTQSISEGSATGAGVGLKLVKTWGRHLKHEYSDGQNRLELMLPMDRDEQK